MGIIGRTLALILRAFELVMVIRAVMSWIMPGDANRFTQIVYGITEPVIAPVRRLLNFCFHSRLFLLMSAETRFV